MLYVDPNVKRTFRKSQPEGRAPFVRLDQNENPDGVPEWLFDEAMSQITPATLSMYPEEGPLHRKYAKLLGLGEENVCLTDGSLVGMGYLVKVFGEPGKDIVFVNPTFNMYGVFASLNGLNARPVPYRDGFRMDIGDILDAIGERTSIVVLVNPNMPIGNVYSEEEIVSVIEKAGEYGALVIVDEAYHYFYEGTSVELVKKYDNLAVLRTFSKMLAITGLRLGAVISCRENIHHISNWRPHYTISAVTLRFGEAIVDRHDRLVEEQSRTFAEGRDYVLGWLNDHDYETIPSSGCFVCLRTKHRTAEYVTSELRRRNILILCGSGPLEGYLRLSVCGVRYMRAFTDALAEIDTETDA